MTSLHAAGLPSVTAGVPGHEMRLDLSRGAIQPRPDGGRVQLVIDQAHFELRFFDRRERRVATSLEHAVAVYRSSAHGRLTTILNPTDDRLALRSVDVVDGPYAYHVHVALFRPGETQPVESYGFDFDRGAARD